MSSSSALSSLLSGSSSSSSGIDLSSILAAETGASSPGIDVTSAVAAAIYADRAPERLWQADQTTLSNQTTALTNIQTATEAVYTDLQNLNTLNGALSARAVTSSASSSVTATATNGATTGTHSIVVNNLATQGSWYSDMASSATATLAASSFTITTAGGASQTFQTGSGTSGDTLQDLATAVNGANLGVTASVVSDSTGARLSLVANSTGTAADFAVSAQAGLGFTQASAAKDASAVVDGVPITSGTNTLTGALSGVTISLLAPTSGTPASLNVQSDTTQADNAIYQLVTDYNTAIGLVNAQFKVSSSTDSSGNQTASQGVLAADSTVRNLQSALENAIGYSYKPATGTTTVSTLADLGVTMNSDGTLDFDSNALNTALGNSAADVQTFFQGNALNGFANNFYNALSTYTDPADGAFQVDLKSMSSQNQALSQEIDEFESGYIASQQTLLTNEYSTAEEALQSLPEQMAQLNSELGFTSKSS